MCVRVRIIRLNIAMNSDPPSSLVVTARAALQDVITGITEPNPSSLCTVPVLRDTHSVDFRTLTHHSNAIESAVSMHHNSSQLVSDTTITSTHQQLIQGIGPMPGVIVQTSQPLVNLSSVKSMF